MIKRGIINLLIRLLFNLSTRPVILLFRTKDIKKFIYKVFKGFTLNAGKLEKLSRDKDLKHKSGSHFSVGDMYVDYESPDNDVEITEMTKTLLSRNFLKLESQVEI